MRKLPHGTVTFLFTDIEGSTRLLQELGGGFPAALAEHRRVLREAFAQHRGVEVDTQGDAFFVAFARAADALAAAEEGQRALRAGPIRVRMGIHTGEPVLNEEGYVGIDVHRAARICAVAHGGQIVLSESTEALLGGAGAFQLDDLGVHRLKDLSEPAKLYQVGDGEFPPLRSLNATNLPTEPTPLVGRERELADVLELLSAARLLTLTGAGGSGKTRLALQAAAEVVEEFEDGVFWVSLAALSDPELVLPTVAATVGAKDGLADYVDEKRTLLLLDNLEQILGCAPALAGLLRSCPNLKLLATSRAPLRIGAEQEYEVPPLSDAEAVELFTQRARQVRTSFQPDEHVVEICRRLDGLPLALELAAARVKLLSAAQLLARLGRSLEVLATGARDLPERQRTLRATIEWSYDLLTEDEQQLFVRLAVFAGGCTLEAAEEVCEADIDTMASLVDKSLLRKADERFWMLETICEYASERLEQSQEAEGTRGNHASYFLAVVEALDTRFPGATEPLAFEQMSSEHDNLRAALGFTYETGDVDSELRLAIGLQRFWRLHGHRREGRRWLEDALGKGTHEPRLRARGLRALANVAVGQHDSEAVISAAEEALPIFRAHGDVPETIDCLNALGGAMLDRGDIERARSYYEEGEQLARASDDTFRLAAASANLGNLDLEEAAYTCAQKRFEESLELFRTLELHESVALSLVNAGLVALHLTQYNRAAALFYESLELSNGLHYVEHTIYAVEGLAAVLAAQGESEAAVKLSAGAEIMEESIGIELDPFEQNMHDRTVELGRSGLSRKHFDAALAAGRRMTWDEVILHALAAVD